MSGAGSFFSGLAGGASTGLNLKERRKDREAQNARTDAMQASADRKQTERGIYYDGMERGFDAAGKMGGGAATSGGGGRASTSYSGGGNRDTFIADMMPYAIEVGQQTGLDPRLIIAQAAQETGWGKSAPGNNFFGIKSHGKAGGNTMATNEVVNGQTVRINDSFRGYEGMGDSVRGYGEFLQTNPRYKPMLAAGDLDGQLAALGRSGYATDPNYAASVGSIANSIRLPSAAPKERAAPPPAPTAAPASVSSGKPLSYSRGVIPKKPAGEEILSRFYGKKAI
jgi:flagellar protein FlgJ